ncbi:O-antigen ligase family protein [bacterium]|nr:O-antigen ligase family protein [bacterium]
MPDHSNKTDRETWTPERISFLVRNIVLVIVGGIALGLFATAANLYYVAAAVFGAVLVVVVAWQFEAALVVYVLVAFVPWGRTPDIAVGGSGAGKGVFISEVMLGFLLVIWFARYLFGSIPKDRVKSGFYVPLALYIAYCIVNVVNSYIFWDPHINRIFQNPMVNIVDLGLRILSAGALVMVATTISNRKWLKITTIAMLIPGIYNLLNALVGYPVPVSALWWSFLTLLPACYFTAMALDIDKKRWQRILCGVVVALCLYVICFKVVSWVSGWLALLCGLAAVLAIKNKRLFWAACIVFVVVVIAAWPFINRNVVEESKTGGDYDRFSLMLGAWKYATHFPLGVGLGNYRSYNSFYYGHKWGTTAYTSAHGTYSQCLSETGIPGLILFLSILVMGFRWMLVRYRAMPPGFSKTFLLAVLGQFVGISITAFFGDYIIPAYHNEGLTTFATTVYSWLFWGLAIAHIRLSGKDV